MSSLDIAGATWRHAVVSGVNVAAGKYLPGPPTVAKDNLAVQYARLVSFAVSTLSLCPAAASGWISLSARKASIIFEDTAGFAHYRLNPAEFDDNAFLRLIAKPLKDTELNNVGVLWHIMTVLSAYYDHAAQSSVTPILNIQISQ